MNKQILDQVMQAMEANQNTIARQKQIIQWREQEIKTKESHIAQLRELLNQLAETQSKELKALPTLFKDLETSMNGTIKEYQSWMEAQKKQQTAQNNLAKELLELADRQKMITTSMSSYYQELSKLESTKVDVKGLEQKLIIIQDSQKKIEVSQTQISSSKEILTKSQKETESQVARLNLLLSNLKS